VVYWSNTYKDDIQTLSLNVIVFMLRGLNEKVTCDVILEIISDIEKISYKVYGLVSQSDMGPKNQAIWRTLGMKVGKDNNIPFITSHTTA